MSENKIIGTVDALTLGAGCTVKDNGKGTVTLHTPGGPVVSRSKFWQSLLRQQMKPAAPEPEPDKGPAPVTVHQPGPSRPAPARETEKPGFLQSVNDWLNEP